MAALDSVNNLTLAWITPFILDFPSKIPNEKWSLEVETCYSCCVETHVLTNKRHNAFFLHPALKFFGNLIQALWLTHLFSPLLFFSGQAKLRISAQNAFQVCTYLTVCLFGRLILCLMCVPWRGSTNFSTVDVPKRPWKVEKVWERKWSVMF